MRRRDFITLVGGAAAGWPLAARAQRSDQMRRIGVLMSFAADDAAAQARLTVFLQTLQQLGWMDGRNVRIDIRWSASEPERIRRYAAELVAFMPDVILASTTPGVAALQQATRTLPIVFVQVADPVGAGLVAESGEAGQQRHRLYYLRIRHGCEMVGTAQGHRAAGDASRNPAGPRQRRRHWHARRHPICGAVVGNAVKSNQLIRC